MVIALLLVVLAALVGVGAVLVQGARAARTLQIQLSSHGVQDEASAREAAGRDDAFRHQLSDLGQRLERVSDTMARLREDRAGQHGQLLERVAEAHRVTEALRSTTEGLERALANPQARGQWGERMADDVLRAAGFVEGINYVKQRTLPDGTRPDVTFLLPDDRVQHMDVKFPLAGYLRWCSAAGDADRAAALKSFLQDVRSRVKELTKPSYLDERTPGFVLLFIPNESVYGFIHGHDPDLADHALAQRVVLCSPFTLFAVLGVIRQATDAVALQRGADEVLEVLAGFTKQWDGFTERLDALGKNLQTVTNTYEQLSGPRRRQLERQLDRVETVRQRRGLSDPNSESDAVLRDVSNW